MIDDVTARWALPLLKPGQAQKEMVHNEAIVAIDLAILSVVVGILSTPPCAPDPGQCWIIGADPEGEWVGKTTRVAGWTMGGWRFIEPVDGMSVWLLDQGLLARFDEGIWAIGDQTARRLLIDGEQVVGSRQPAIADPSGGTVIDVEARTTIGNLMNALRAHGLIQN